ncbi:MAG: hypothetical protein ACR2PL_02875 [Dehalococcoidia bacterium]
MTSSTTYSNPQAPVAELAELSNQTYLSFIDGLLRLNERNIRLTQNFLSQAETVQGQLRQAFEQATEQVRSIQATSRTLTTEVLDASAQILEANRNTVQAFNSVLYEAGRRTSDFAETAVNETRAAQQETRAKVSATVDRARTAGEIVAEQAGSARGNGTSKARV